MTVTITILRNGCYCEEHGLVQVDRYPCFACTNLDPACPPDADCPVCEGTGQEAFRSYPFELNVANRNFATLWSALGLDADYCGRMDSRQLQAALRAADAALILRDTVVETSPARATFIDQGISPDQARRYLEALAEIASEAERREEPIVWG